MLAYHEHVDRAEYEDLYDRHADSVFTKAVLRVGINDAADVLSETFMVAWEKRAKAPDDPSARVAWLATIAQYKAHEAHRRRRRAKRDRAGGSFDKGNVAEPASGDDPSAQVIASIEARALYAQLNESDQELFELAHVYGLRTEMIAETLGISVTACSTRLSRLRHRLEELEVSAAETSTAETGAAKVVKVDE